MPARQTVPRLLFSTQKFTIISIQKYTILIKTILENLDKIDLVLESKKYENTITFEIDENKANKKLTSEQENDLYDE